MARQDPETTIPVDGQRYRLGRKKGVYNAATDAFVVRGKIVPRAETLYAAPPGRTTPGTERTMEEREAILNAEIALDYAVSGLYQHRKIRETADHQGVPVRPTVQVQHGYGGLPIGGGGLRLL